MSPGLRPFAVEPDFRLRSLHPITAPPRGHYRPGKTEVKGFFVHFATRTSRLKVESANSRSRFSVLYTPRPNLRFSDLPKRRSSAARPTGTSPRAIPIAVEFHRAKRADTIPPAVLSRCSRVSPRLCHSCEACPRPPIKSRAGSDRGAGIHFSHGPAGDRELKTGGKANQSVLQPTA